MAVRVGMRVVVASVADIRVPPTISARSFFLESSYRLARAAWKRASLYLSEGTCRTSVRGGEALGWVAHVQERAATHRVREQTHCLCTVCGPFSSHRRSLESLDKW
jgi:hypothetical protein